MIVFEEEPTIVLFVAGVIFIAAAVAVREGFRRFRHRHHRRHRSRHYYY
ncbi:MAG: hypothetical protein WA817_16520 [Candidatus Acidiferrum sp.]